MVFQRRMLVLPLILATLFLAYSGIQRPEPGVAASRSVLRATQPFPPPDPQVQLAYRLLHQVNLVRYEQGQLAPLKANAALESAARGHSQCMAAGDFFGHKGLDQSSPWDRMEAAGYTDWFVLAENIAVGYGDAQEVVQAWLESPDHRANMLNPEVREAGVGYTFDPEDAYPGETWGYQHYWTMDMGACPEVYPLIIEREAYSITGRIVSLYIYGHSGIREMRLSNDAVGWTPWLRYQQLYLWELAAEEGFKRVYVQLRDAEGSVYQAEDEILLVESPRPSRPEILKIEPEQAFFVALVGTKEVLPRKCRLRITEGEDGILAWHASWSGDWLQLSTSSGIAPSQIVMSLTDQVEFLPPGTYTTTLVVEGEGQKDQLQVYLFVFPQVYRVYLPFAFPRPSY